MAEANDRHGSRAERIENSEGAGNGARPFDILVLGPVPPPYGGVSTHLGRFVPLLEEAGLTVGVLNHYSATDGRFVVGALKRNPLRYLRLPRKFPARLVHYHHARLPHLLAVALGQSHKQPRARYVVTFHGRGIARYLPQRGSRTSLLARATSWALGRFDAVVVVNPDLAQRLREEFREKRIEVIPAFVLPASMGQGSDRYNDDLESFLSSGRVLIVGASGIRFTSSGGDVYGLDTAVDAFIELAAARPNLRLAVFVAQRPLRGRERRHLDSLEERLAHAGLRDRARICFELSLLPALRDGVVLLRPTRADGDAVSIREALNCGVGVVASDVAERPAGVAVFPVDDRAALCSAVDAMLDDLGPAKPSGRQVNARSFAGRLIELYRSELSQLHGNGALQG